jgi:predicted dienelactone hydrolase
MVRGTLLLWLAAIGFSLAAGPAAADELSCVKGSGTAGVRCLKHYAGAIEKCRRDSDARCESALRSEGGFLDQALAAVDEPIREHCDAQASESLGYTSVDDVVLRASEACADFAEEHVDLAFADDPAALAPDALRCQQVVAKQLAHLREKSVDRFGKRCLLRRYRGRVCDLDRRDRRIANLQKRVRAKIRKRCREGFSALGLGAGASADAQLDDLLAVVVNRARYFAQRAYPPNDLGPAAGFGPHPIGVRTLLLEDPSRPDVREPTNPRPLLTEIYYPSTDAAIAGVPRDVASVLDIPVAETPAYRDVAIAEGAFPLILFSHGNNGIRFQSFFFAAHLASHGFVVAAPDHHGNTFLDALSGNEDAESGVNRPLDMSFLIDQLIALSETQGGFLEGAIDPDRIGASGHSFGGYTSFALAGGPFDLGTFTDPRVRAILPQAPASNVFDDAFFSTITIPTLIVGGSLDETTGFATQQQRPFDLMTPGPAVLGLAELPGAGHFTFSDFCEVPRAIVAFLGGFEEACEPRHLPWRHAHDIVNHLALHFFDGILNGSPAALAALEPARLAAIEDLAYQSK